GSRQLATNFWLSGHDHQLFCPNVNVKNLFVAVTPGFLKPCWARLEASPLGYRLARGTFWSLAGGLTARLLTVLASILVAGALGKERCGEFGIIQSTVATF